MLDMFDVSKFEIRALELLGELHQLTAQEKSVTFSEEFTLLKSNDSQANTLSREQEEYLLLYSLDDAEESQSVSSVQPSDCRTTVSYVCSPETKELTVGRYSSSSQ